MASTIGHILLALTVVFSLLVVTSRRPIMGALALIVTLLATAGVYVWLQAEFVAILQVLVYAGGILVLFLYIMMLLGIKSSVFGKLQWLVMAAFAAAMSATIIIPVERATSSLGSENGANIATNFGTIEGFGRYLLAGYGYPFEIISVVLLAVIAGVVLLTRKEG